MDPITARLTVCFQKVFPDLPEAEIPSASQASVPAWDSVASIALLNVIEEVFEIQADFDRLGDLNSFHSFHEYLSQEAQLP